MREGYVLALYVIISRVSQRAAVVTAAAAADQATDSTIHKDTLKQPYSVHGFIKPFMEAFGVEEHGMVDADEYQMIDSLSTQVAPEPPFSSSLSPLILMVFASLSCVLIQTCCSVTATTDNKNKNDELANKNDM